MGLVIFSLLSSPLVARTFSPLNHPLYPLEIGAEWKYKYREKISGETGIVSVKIKKLTSSSGNSETAILSRIMEVEGRPFETEFEISLKNSQIYERLLSLPVALPQTELGAAALIVPDLKGLLWGRKWKTGASFKFNWESAYGQAEAELYSRVIDWGMISVPAGEFYTLKIESRYQLVEGEAGLKLPPVEKTASQVPSGVIQEWYAPFTGLVKSIDSEGNTLELISFNLKPEPEEFGVIELRGDVKINEQEARTDWIYDGDFTIETARDAKVVLYFGNNQRLTIEGASKSEISHKKKEPDASIETIITLFRGKLLILVNEFFQERRLKVETHGAWAGVRGTKFSVEVKEDRDIIEVFEGEVEVKEKKTGKIFILKAGEKKVILY